MDLKQIKQAAKVKAVEIVENMTHKVDKDDGTVNRIFSTIDKRNIIALGIVEFAQGIGVVDGIGVTDEQPDGLEEPTKAKLGRPRKIKDGE